MRLTRLDYADDLARLRASRRAEQRALGDNFLFEENVGSDRQADFEGVSVTGPGLRAGAADYFFTTVQGVRRGHTPTTFSPVNGPALLPAGIEPVRKIVRLECIDDALSRMAVTLRAGEAAMAASPREASVLDPLIRVLNQYPGARPAFACFKAEVAADLREPDWLIRLLAREAGQGPKVCLSC